MFSHICPIQLNIKSYYNLINVIGIRIIIVICYVRYCFFNNKFISKCMEIKRQWRSQPNKADSIAEVRWWKLSFTRITEERILARLHHYWSVSEQERTLPRCKSLEVEFSRDLWGWTPRFTSTHTKIDSGERAIYRVTETLTVKPKIVKWVYN